MRSHDDDEKEEETEGPAKKAVKSGDAESRRSQDDCDSAAECPLCEGKGELSVQQLSQTIDSAVHDILCPLCQEQVLLVVGDAKSLSTSENATTTDATSTADIGIHERARRRDKQKDSTSTTNQKKKASQKRANAPGATTLVERRLTLDDPDSVAKMIAMRDMYLKENSEENPTSQPSGEASNIYHEETNDSRQEWNSNVMVAWEELAHDPTPNAVRLPDLIEAVPAAPIAARKGVLRASNNTGPRPGAYQKFPGEALVRNQTMRFSLLHRSPSLPNVMEDVTRSGSFGSDGKVESRSIASIREGLEMRKNVVNALGFLSSTVSNISALDLATPPVMDTPPVMEDSADHEDAELGSMPSDGVYEPRSFQTASNETLRPETIVDSGAPGSVYRRDVPGNDDQPETNGERGLIEATLVQEHSILRLESGDDNVFLEAKAVSDGEMAWHCLRSSKGLATVFCLFASVIGIIVGLSVGLQGAGDKNTAPSFSPSESPSMSPTQAPTVEFRTELLPNFTVQAILSDPQSPQARALDWIIDDPFLQELEPARKLIRYGLATLYFATNGDQWIESSNWLSYDHHECKWGASSNQTAEGCVDNMLTHLKLQRNLLNGVLPLELGLLAGLTLLDLHDNGLLSIPSTIGMLSSSLETLVLSSNSIALIPSEIGHLTSLKDLRLNTNDLKRALPTELGNLRELNTLDASENRFSGSIPVELGRLQQLVSLHMHDSALTGTLPAGIGALYHLSSLNLERTDMSGTLPSELSQLEKLTELFLQGSKFIGKIPSELGLLKKLSNLGLSYNQFSGTIASELGLMSTRNLYLNGNSFVGGIPSEIFLNSNLQVFRVDYNPYLVGSLPTEIGLASGLKSIFVRKTRDAGTLPTEIGLLVNLLELDAYSCQMSGEIPSEIGNLRRLTTLEISFNGILGAIPSETGELKNLVKMNLDHNGITKFLPSEIGDLALLHVLDIGHNLLTGTLPFEMAGMRQLTELLLQENRFTGALPAELFQLSRLELLQLTGNSFTGKLPSQVGGMRQLTALLLEGSSLTGTLPVAMFNLSRLKELVLSGSTFTGELFSILPISLRRLEVFNFNINGTVPEDISRLIRLEHATLSFSSLKGTIPSTLGLLTRLSHLDLWDNQVSGTIPSQIGLLSLLTFLDLDHNELQGSIPGELFDLTKLTSLFLSFNSDLTGTVPTSFCDLPPEHFVVDCPNVSCACCDCALR